MPYILNSNYKFLYLLFNKRKYKVLFVQKKECVKSLIYFVTTKVYQFKAKDSEIKDYSLCFGNISKDFTINSMKKTGLKGAVKYFSVDFNPIDTNDILDIHKYLMKTT